MLKVCEYKIHPNHMSKQVKDQTTVAQQAEMIADS